MIDSLINQTRIQKDVIGQLETQLQSQQDVSARLEAQLQSQQDQIDFLHNTSGSESVLSCYSFPEGRSLPDKRFISIVLWGFFFGGGGCCCCCCCCCCCFFVFFLLCSVFCFLFFLAFVGGFYEKCSLTRVNVAG